MIALVEGAIRQRTPNEIALSLVLSAFTLIFLIVTARCGRWLYAELYMPATSATGRQPGHRHPDAGRAAGLPDPDDHRRLAGGHRHRRHGPGAAGQHHRQERQGGRGGRRHRHAAAGQDRHDHDRQPPGDAVRAAGRLLGRASWRGWPALASMADQTPEGKSIVELCPRSTAAARRRGCRAGAHVRRVHRPDAHERHRPARRPRHPQGCARRRRPLRPASTAARSPTAIRSRSTRSPRSGATPLLVCRGQPHRRRGRAGRHPQAGHPRALRAAAADGPARR